MFENGVCYICNHHFGIRSDSKIGHSLLNCKPCCKICNYLKSDSDDLKMIKLTVQLNNFAYEYGLSMTLGKGDSDNYFIMRDSIAG
jgi:hypothetical protein